MQPLTLQEMSAAMAGRILGTVTLPRAEAVATDTRHPVAGALFFAIKGPNFDGHRFVTEALERGAVAAVVSDLSGLPNALIDQGRIIQVSDTVQALGRLGAWYRTQFAATVIAVVGSNGKTTTKEMIAAVLGSQKRGKAAVGSYNNAIGVPLTLLSVERGDEFVVVEVGTNSPGEVQALGRLCRPDVAVVTSIAEEHLEFLRNLESVAGEEFSIISTMGRRAFLLVSEEAARFMPEEAKEKCTCLRYGFSAQADLRAEQLRIDGQSQRFLVNGRFEYRLPALGRHNVMNALAAIGIGTRLRMTHDQIAAGLARTKLPPMRQEPVRLGPMLIINDSYNANPGSMKAAFEVMDQLPQRGRKVLILGEMLELGAAAARCHAEVGREASRCSAALLIFVGPHARAAADGALAASGTLKRIYSFPTIEALEERFDALLQPDDTVLLKASRGMRFERVLESLRKWVGGAAPAEAGKSR